jgi:malonate transporter and related proteins
VKQPYVWAPVLALLLVLSGMHVPSIIISTLKLIGQTASGVSLFVGGLLLAAYSFVLNRAVAANVILKSVIQPALLLAIVERLGIPNPLECEGQPRPYHRRSLQLRCGLTGATLRMLSR